MGTDHGSSRSRRRQSLIGDSYRSTFELYPTWDGETLIELSKFREAYEAANGPTDCRYHFSTEAPSDVQLWLLKHRPEHYVRMMPPFVLAFLKERWKRAANLGLLEDLPDNELVCYFADRMPV